MRQHEQAPAMNTDPPGVRCGMCRGRCRRWKRGWIECANGCAWSSHDPRRTGPWWALRVLLGI